MTKTPFYDLTFFCSISRSMYSSYTATGGPRAFLPHSAINLSVKTDSSSAVAASAAAAAAGLHSSSRYGHYQVLKPFANF